MTRNAHMPLSRRSLIRNVVGLGAGAVLSAETATMLFGTSRSARAQTKEAVSCQLNWIKSVQFGGHFAAQEQGYFAKEGVEAEILGGGPGIDSINLVASGRVTVGDRDSSTLLLARAKGTPVRAFAAAMQRNPYAVMSLKSKPIRSLKDMVGKTIAIPQQRRASMAALLKKANIDASSVSFVPVGTDPGILASGQVDGYFGYVTNQGVMLRMRGVDVEAVTLQDLGDPSYPMTFFATEQTLATRGDAVVRWLRAEIQGWRWFAENPEATAKFVVEKYAQQGLDLAQQTEEAKLYRDYIMPGGVAESVLWIDKTIFEQAMALAKDAGALTGDVDIEPLVDQSFLRKAQGKA